MEEIFYLLTFNSTHVAIKCENILKNKEIYNKIIGIPSEISAGCGLSLKIKPEDLQRVLEILIDESETFVCYKIIKNGLNKKIEKI